MPLNGVVANFLNWVPAGGLSRSTQNLQLSTSCRPITPSLGARNLDGHNLIFGSGFICDTLVRIVSLELSSRAGGNMVRSI